MSVDDLEQQEVATDKTCDNLIAETKTGVSEGAQPTTYKKKAKKPRKVVPPDFSQDQVQQGRVLVNHDKVMNAVNTYETCQAISF